MIMPNPTMPMAPAPPQAPTTSQPQRDTLRLAEPTAHTPIEYAKDIVQQIKQRWEDAQFAKLWYFGEWYLNMAFYAGRQWCSWNRGGQFLRDVPNPLDLVRHTANRIRPICDAVMSLLASGKPEIEVVPATHQVEDEQSAEISAALLDYANEVTHWQDLKRDRDGFRVLYGTACIRYGLNPEPVRVLNVPIPNPAGGPPQTVPMPEYELQGFCYNPFDFALFPVNAPSARDVRAVMFTSYLPVEEAREKWPVDALGQPVKIQPAVDIAPNEFYRRQQEMLFSPSAYTNADPGNAMRGMVRVYEYLELPTRTYPAGCKKTVVNDHLVEKFDNPFVGLFPPEAPNLLKLGIVLYRGLQVPGRILGVGGPEDLRDLQVRHNKMITQQERNRIACGNVKILLDGQVIDKNQLTNDDVNVIMVRGRVGSGQAYQVVPPTLIDFSREIAQNDRDMEDIGRRPPITRGFNQAQVRSGEQTSMLQAGADMVFTLMGEDTEQGDANVARLKLALIKRYYNAPKILRVVGSAKGYAAAVIANCDIYTDVRVIEGSGLPKNKEAFNSLIAEYFKMGAIVDQNGRPDVSWLRSNLHLGGRTVEDPTKIDRDHAQTENVQMSQTGQPAMVNPWDNHVIEIEQHELHLKKNPHLPPPIQQVYLIHIQMHGQALIQTILQPATPTAGMPAPATLQPAGAPA